MAEKKIKTRVQNKHDYEYNWSQATGFIPLAGEIIVYDADINAPGAAKGTHSLPRFKVGDGVTTVVTLPFIDANSYIISSGATDPTTATIGQYYFKYKE